MTKRLSREERAAAEANIGVPFSAPKDDSTRAIIVRNASCSPLLRLPLEIRDNIWRSVLGDQLIHLEYLGNFERQTFRHIVCEQDRPEDELVEGSSWTNNNGDVETVWRQPHYHCDIMLAYHPGIDPKRWGHKSMHLKALRVCRQIYSEANHVLWTTNTFSFNDAALSFHHFMEERTPPQKRLLKRLRLQMDWVWGEDRPWKRAFGIWLIKSLAGVRSLRLQINHSVEVGFHQQAETCGNELALFEPEHLELVRRIAKLPLVDVEVFIGDRSQPCNFNAFWMARDRNEYADAIRKVLLDPNGAQKCSKAKALGRILSTGQREGTEPGL